MTPYKNDYYPYFDYLRIALAMVVLLHHDHVFEWAHSGNLAVQVFFCAKRVVDRRNTASIVVQ